MKNIGVFVSENFQFWEVKFSIYSNRSVFVMVRLGFFKVTGNREVNFPPNKGTLQRNIRN